MGKLPNLVIGAGGTGINIEDKNKTIQISDNDINKIMIPTEAIGPLIQWLQTKTESQKKTLQMVLIQVNGLPQYIIVPNEILPIAQILAQKLNQFDKGRDQDPNEFYCATPLNLEIAEVTQKYDIDPETLWAVINDFRTKLEKGSK